MILIRAVFYDVYFAANVFSSVKSLQSFETFRMLNSQTGQTA